MRLCDFPLLKKMKSAIMFLSHGKKGRKMHMKKYILIVIALLYSFLNVNILFAETWTKKADFGGTDAAAQLGFSIGVKGYRWNKILLGV